MRGHFGKSPERGDRVRVGHSAGRHRPMASASSGGIWQSLVAVVVGVVRAIVSLLMGQRQVKGAANSSFRVHVKVSGSDHAVPLVIDPSWSIADIKASLGPKLNISPHELRIIFAGKELPDSLKIQDCDVGNQTIIHAVRVKHPHCNVTASNDDDNGPQTLDGVEASCSITDAIVKIQLAGAECDDATLCKGSPKSHFFVYCSDPCRNVCPGKLRVRCCKCKQGTLTVSQEPCCWEDVLAKGRIAGVCQADECGGRVAEFYFKCASHFSEEDHSAVALYLLRNNYKEVPCLACTDVSPLILVFPCEAQHVMCLDCFRVYCLTRLNERRFVEDDTLGYTLPCPVGCDNSLIRETHHFRLLGDEQYARYQRFGAEECLLKAGGVLCPRPGCGAGILPDADCKRVVCIQQGGQGCGFVFCRQCLQGYHIGGCEEPGSAANGNGDSEYRVDVRSADQAKWDEVSRRFIKGTTKPCPKCRTPTEKDGGCMHMVCTRSQCGFHWCWICQAEWTRECMGNHWFG